MSTRSYKPYTGQQTIRKILIRGASSDVSVSGRIQRLDRLKSLTIGTLTDGSGSTLQFVTRDRFPEEITVGASVILRGTLVESPGKDQDWELKLQEGEGVVPISLVRDPASFEWGADAMKQRGPEATLDRLSRIRRKPHMRIRDPTVSAIMRIRSTLKASLFYCLHDRFGLFQVDTPILTRSDCEGAGEMFTVTALDFEDPESFTEDGKVDWDKDFFRTQYYLSVSGQLEGEAYTQVLLGVFTFGPTFRAEHSDTSRHLGEFWMIEPEIYFTCGDIHERFAQLLDLEESLVKHVVETVLQERSEDLKLLDQTLDDSLLERLQTTVSSDFARITYTQAISILLEALSKGHSFGEGKDEIEWGMDLESEHEKYICEEVFGVCTFVTHYPKSLKSFYMKEVPSEEAPGPVVQAVDLLIPGVGELCGGSMREDDPDKLLASMEAKGLSHEGYEWYVDLRRDGGFPTGGFGLGFERLVVYCTGARSVRDVIPFPRHYRARK